MPDLTTALAAADAGKWTQVIEYLQALPRDRVRDLASEQQILDLALRGLSGGDFEQQWEIAKIIPKLGEIAIEPLLEIVTDREVEIEDRWFAARILGEFARPQVVAALVEIVRADEEPELTQIASNALTQIGTAAIAAATAMLVNPTERHTAVAILARIRHSQTIEPLIRVVDDANSQIRHLAIEALSSFHDPRVPPILIAKLTDPVAIVRQAAVVGLSLRGDLAAELDLVSQLQPLLFDLNLAVCETTALGLARLPEPRTVEVLAGVLRSPRTPASLQIAIVRSLGWIGSQAAIDLAIEMLPIASTELGVEIARSIGKTERERPYASQTLARYLQADPPPSTQLKQEILTTLGNLGDRQCVSDLIQLLGDPDDRIKLYAITSIAKLSPEIPPEILHLAARQDDLEPQLQIGLKMLLDRWQQRSTINNEGGNRTR